MSRAALAAVSVAVQALGAFSYDYRWERLYWRGGDGGRAPAALWDVVRSPIPFYLQRRVVILALPAVKDGRAYVREHPVVVLGPTGSRVVFSSDPPRVDGADATMEDVHLQRGARVEDGRAAPPRAMGRRAVPRRGRRRGSAASSCASPGRGQGVLYVGEKTFWSEQPRWSTYPVSGAFRLRHPYDYATSGGPDVIVTIGKSPGEIDLESMALVAPGEPANPVRVP